MSISPTAYRVYVLKRLAFERTRGEVDADTFGALCRAVLEKHATDGYADPALRKAAIAAANIAIVDVCARMRDPDFDLATALAEAEAALVADRASADRTGSATSAPDRAPGGGPANGVGAGGSASVGADAVVPGLSGAGSGTGANGLSAVPESGTAAGRASPRNIDRPTSDRIPAPGMAASAMGERPGPQGASTRYGWIAGMVAGAIAGGVTGFLVAFFALGPSGGERAASLAPVVGDWTWMGGAHVRFVANGNFTFNGFPAGHYFATSARHFILVHDNGRFVDYVTLDGNGQRLTGYSAAGVAISATRVR